MGISIIRYGSVWGDPAGVCVKQIPFIKTGLQQLVVIAAGTEISLSFKHALRSLKATLIWVQPIQSAEGTFSSAVLSSLLYLHATPLGRPHKHWINPVACVYVCGIRRAGCSGAFPFKAMKQNAWKHTHKLDTHTHTHNIKTLQGKKRVKKRAIGLEEKESCRFFYYVSSWSTHPEGQQHT